MGAPSRRQPLVIGLLGALPVACNVLNMPAAWLTHVVGRKRLAVAAVGASRLVCLPLVAFPYLPVSDATRLQLFIALVAVTAVLAVIGNNAWIAWMGDLVPASVRGRFFGRRTMFLTVAGATSSLGAGLMLDALSPRGWKSEALAGLAAVACLAGLVSIWLLRRQHEPAPANTLAEPGGLAALGACLRDRAVRPFLWYQLAWNAAVAAVGGFISFHMLVNLQMAFAVVAAHGVAVAVVRIIARASVGPSRRPPRRSPRPRAVLVRGRRGAGDLDASHAGATVADRARGGAGRRSLGRSRHRRRRSVGCAGARSGRPFYLAAFATAGGLGFAAASILAGLLASLLPAQFMLLGFSWTGIHILLLVSALARAAAALLAVRIQERDARGVPELLLTLASDLPKTVSVKHLRLPKPWAVFQTTISNAAAQGRRRPPASGPRAA